MESHERALADHQGLPMRLEEARTRLLYGTVLRRAGRRTDGRHELEAALAVFIRLGTPIQVHQTTKELKSIGGRPPHSELTSEEGRNAHLVGVGQNNREVASALF